MKTLKCPSCGAPIKPEDTTCQYCGATISHDDEKKSIIDEVEKSIKIIGNKLNLKQDFNWIIFILLLVFIFPVGIIYFVLNLNDTND